AATVNRAAAERMGISVMDTPQAAMQAVAEMTLGLILSLARGLPALDRSAREGRWECSYGSELQGKVLGLAGYGGIGGRVAAMGRALGMHVHATRTRPSGPLSPSAEEVEFMELREVCGSADFLSVHLRD